MPVVADTKLPAASTFRWWPCPLGNGQYERVSKESLMWISFSIHRVRVISQGWALRILHIYLAGLKIGPTASTTTPHATVGLELA